MLNRDWGSDEEAVRITHASHEAPSFLAASMRHRLRPSAVSSSPQCQPTSHRYGAHQSIRGFFYWQSAGPAPQKARGIGRKLTGGHNPALKNRYRADSINAVKVPVERARDVDLTHTGEAADLTSDIPAAIFYRVRFDLSVSKGFCSSACITPRRSAQSVAPT